MDLKEIGCGLDLSGTLLGFYEHGNESSGSIKDR
jgi:hypothetical protein